MLTLKTLTITVAEDILFFYYYFQKIKDSAFNANRVDDSHDMSRLIFSEK